MDQVDYKILQILQNQARMPIINIGGNWVMWYAFS